MKRFLVLILLLTIIHSAATKNETIVDIRTQIEGEDVRITIMSDGSAEVIVGAEEFKSPLYRAQYLADQLYELREEITEAGESRIYLKSGENTLNMTYNPVSSGEFQNLVEKIYVRITGKDTTQAIWPVDISVFVMESYPEQYGVSAIIKRGNDLLAYVVEQNVSLLVVANMTSLVYSDQVSFSIASGGQTAEVTFDIFSVGSNHRPSDLRFIVEVGNYSIDDNWNRVNLSGVQPLDTGTLVISSNLSNLPLAVPILGLLLIPLIRKKFRNLQST